MVKNYFTDLKIVLILTFLSLLFLFIPSLNHYPQNMVSYALILIFLPGYSILAAVKPSVNKMGVWKSIFWSIVLGAAFTTAVYVLWRYTSIMTYLNPITEYLSPFEAYTSPLEAYIPFIFILSTILVVDAVAISWARRRETVQAVTPEFPGEKERYVWCEECKGYYKLEKDESPEDFEGCQCGGRLIYTEKAEGEKLIPPEQEIEPVVQKGSSYLDLLLVFLLSIISLAVLEVSGQVNSLIEFLLILFLPGYAFVSMMYPQKGDIGVFGRLVYSVASSIAITALVGVILNYTSYSNLMGPILYVLVGMSFVFLLAALFRRYSIKEEERYKVYFSGFFLGLRKGFSRETGSEKLLSLLLITSVVLVGFTTYIIANPFEETYTDFYVLDANGNPVESVNLTSGESDNLTISIVNQENKETSYRLLVTSGGNVQLDQTVTLQKEEKKDINFNFTVGEPGTRDMEFKLYKLSENEKVYKIIKILLTVYEIPVEESTFVEPTLIG